MDDLQLYIGQRVRHLVECKVIKSGQLYCNLKVAALITGRTEKSLYNLIERRKIPFHKGEHDSRVLFDIAEILAYMFKSRVFPCYTQSQTYQQQAMI